MQTTDGLNVVTDFKSKNKITIHPNDGLDIGLMNSSYLMNFSTILTEEKEVFQGEISLSNDCKHQTIIINPNLWQKIGKLKSIKLSISDDKKTIFIVK